MQSSCLLLLSTQGRIPRFDAAIRDSSTRANADGHPLRGQFFLHRQRVPLDQIVLRPRSADQVPTEVPGCGPWTRPHPAEPVLGGLDLAVELVLGGQLAWYAETDRHAQTVLARHNTADHRQPQQGHITTGSPLRVLHEQQPPLHHLTIVPDRTTVDDRLDSAVNKVFVENVAALLRRGFDVVHRDLAALGYDTRWLCLRASDIGAAHRRDRLFLLYLDTFRSWWWRSQDASERSNTTRRSRTESLRVMLIMVPVAAEVC